MSNIFFNLNDAINCKMDSDEPFIIANERLTRDGNTGRSFKVFNSFDEFMNERDNYPHCHELLVDHVNIKPERTHGRLVFDFDIDHKFDDVNFVPPNFKEQIEEIIIKTIDDFYQDVDISRLKFVWSSSVNPKKCSKHLTVKNFLFYNWLVMCRRFYKLFQLKWRESGYSWISGNKLIDAQVVRNHGSLRMVGSSKIKGFVLNLDNPKKFNLEDSLIRVYRNNLLEKEQMITVMNEREGLDLIIKENDPKYKVSEMQVYQLFDGPDMDNYPVEEFETNIYKLAFKIFNLIQPRIFKMGKCNKNIISLLRQKPGICPLSGKSHDKENSFLIVNNFNDIVYVSYGCHRHCGSKRSIMVGYIIWLLGKYTFTIDTIFAKKYLMQKRKLKKPKEDPLFLLKLSGAI